MIGYDQALAICRTDPESAARMLCELSRELDALRKEVAALKAENAALRDRVQMLEEQVAKDSHNSHKPPSSDGLAKPKPKSLRPRSDRPTGGQPGHPRHTLRMVEKPDRIVPHRVERCSGCGRSLAGQEPDRVERRQVHDLPEPKLEVTEHQAEVKTCPCGCVNRAAFPPEAAAPVQYGPRVKSVAVYLGEYQLLPFDRLTEIMRDLLACENFSEGTLANFKTDCSRRLEPVEATIRDMTAADRDREPDLERDPKTHSGRAFMATMRPQGVAEFRKTMLYRPAGVVYKATIRKFVEARRGANDSCPPPDSLAGRASWGAPF